MGAIDGFNSTWSQARKTYGEGEPVTGERFDASSTLDRLKSEMDAAAPGGRWTGAAAEAYAKANADHQRVIGAIGEVDKKLAAQVTNAANLVTSGRTDLEKLRTWVNDAAATLPNNQAGKTMKMQLASRGLAQLTEIINNTDGAMQTVKSNMDKLKGEYEALGAGQKFAQDGKGDEDPLGVMDDEKAEDEKDPAEQAKEDSEAFQNGTLTEEQRARIESNTHLSDQQKSELNNGGTTMPPDQMEYLQNFSRQFGNHTPAEIKAMMDKNGSTGDRATDTFQLASNPNIKTGLPETVPPSTDSPASGGKHALPEGIQKVLDGPVLTPLEYGQPVKNPDGSIGLPELTGASQPVSGLNDLADIMQRGDPALQKGTELDAGLFKQSERLLEQTNGWAVPGTDLESDRPRWYHQAVDPTLQNMFNAVNDDHTVIHDAVTGSGGEKFLDNLTQHQWQDDGLAAGGLFDWVGETANADSTGRAAETVYSVATFMSDPDNHLLKIEGTGGFGVPSQSLGEVNPELTRDWARAMTPYFDDMVGGNNGDSNGKFPALDDPLSKDAEPVNTRHLMSVLASDHRPPDIAVDQVDPNAPRTASEITTAAMNSHVNNFFESAAQSVVNGAPEDDYAMRSAAKLQSAFDLGTYDEVANRLGETSGAAHEAWELKFKAFDLMTLGVGTLPGPGDVASDIGSFGKDFIVGTEPTSDDPPKVRIPDNFTIDQHLAQILVNSGQGDLSILGDYRDENGVIQVPSSADAEQYTNAIGQYLDSIGGKNVMNGLSQTYFNTYTSAVVNA